MKRLMQLLRAKHVGVKECRDRMSEYINEPKPVIITFNGEPRQVLIPYDDMVKFVEAFAKQERDLSAVS